MPFIFKDGSVAGTCKVCGKKAWSDRSNRCEEHKIVEEVKVPKRKKGEKKPTVNADGSPKPVATQIVESAGAISAKTFSGKAPTQAEWEEKLVALVVLGTMTYVEYAVVKPLKMNEQDATQAVAYLGMTEEEASTIVEPCSYLLAGSKLNKDHGREAIEILAFAPAILAVIAWADRVSTFRQQMLAAQQSGQIGETYVSPQSTPAPERASGATSGITYANFGGVNDPDQAPTRRSNGASPYVDAAL